MSLKTVLKFIKKNALLTGILCVINNNLHAQLNFPITLNWHPVKINQVTETENIKFIGFEKSLYNFDNQKITPYYNKIIDWVSNKDASISTANILTEKLSDDEKQTIDESLISSKMNISHRVSSERGNHKLIISVIPFIKNNSGEIFKVKSFDLIIDGIVVNTLRETTRQVYANESVLKKGDWYKIAVLSDGLYKITYSDLQGYGIDPSTISPDAINIYGNSFGMLPEVNNQYRPDDLLKNSIFIQGDGDGQIDSEDYILFYAKGPDKWVLNGTYFEHQKNTYSDTAYYFICVDTSTIAPKRISAAALSSSPVTNTVTSFNDFKVVHVDKYNLMKSGREWLGDHYDIITDYSYPFSFSNMDISSGVRIRLALAAKTPGPGSVSSSFAISVPEASFSTSVNVPGIGTGPYPYSAVYAGSGVLTYTMNPSSSPFNVNISFNKYSATAEAWTDFIEVNARRYLSFSGDQMTFRDLNSVGAGNVAEFNLSGFAGSYQVWEITSLTDAALVNGNLNSGLYTFSADADTLRTFVAFNPALVTKKPIYFGRVANQNLHALAYADMLIVTHPDFISQANEIADLHQSEGLSVHIVKTGEIYNEFSSGMKDASAIRMFFKMFYDRAAGDTSLMPKYALLFGDGSYDNMYKLPGNTSFIPTYQSKSYGQLYLISSFTSDDYYGMLDDNESLAGGDLLDICIGRICCRNSSEADGVVKKIIDYSTSIAPPLETGCCDNQVNATLGDWRNWITFIADDEDYDAYIDAAEDFSAVISANHPDYLIKKIYLDAYYQSSTPGGKRYYEAEADLREKVQSGSLLVNYIGHGGEVGWSHERILDLNTINGWTNSPRLPLFMTATCEFSRYDDPGRVSAGEYVLLNSSGGGISLMTTTRLVISGPNEQLNSYFIDLFLQRGTNYLRKRIGEFYRDSKNTIASASPGNSTQTRNFTLLGDPAIIFRIPLHNVVTDSLNGSAVGATADTLKALSLVTIKGHLEDEAGNALSGYNGIVYPVVFDKDQQLTTLANDPPYSSEVSFSSTKNVIYKGKATVTNGRYQFSFVVPKDIAFQYGTGTINYYSQDGNDDANGYNKQIVVGGANANAPTDIVGPVMDIYLNDENFVDGGITNSNPFLIVNVSDENGLNTVGNGIGHDLTAVLDGNTANTIILNDYYESDLDTYQSGRIKYHITDLEPGEHTLKVKVWDVYNNSSEKEIQFTVQDEQELALDHVLNYPNPFTTNTQFMFEHNQSCHTLDVKITIMTITGKIVKTILQTVNAEGFRADPIAWNGLDEYGDKLAIGTYIYRLEVKSEDYKAEKIEKLVILR